MVRHHVAQRAGRLVKSGAPLDADGFGDRDLHMVDVVAVPDRLEDAVGKAQHHDVLDRLLAEEMIHPIDLRLRQHLEDPRIQRAGRGEIVAERLFDDDAAEAAVLFLRQPDGAELLDDRAEQLAGDGKIKDGIAAGLVLRRRLFEDPVQPRISIGLGQIAGEMGDAARDEFPGLLHRTARSRARKRYPRQSS